MARTKKETIIEETEPTEEELVSLEEYESYLSDLGGMSNVSVGIHRLHRNGKDWEWCESDKGLEEAKPDMIRAAWGGGKFKLRFKRDGRYIGHKTLYIAPMPIAPVNNSNNGNGSHSDNEHVQFLREQAAEQKTMMMAMIAAMKGPDIGSILQGIAAMSKTPDPAAMLTALVSAFAAVKPKEEDSLERLKQLSGVIKDLTPDSSGKEDSWPGVIRDAIGAVGGVLSGRPAQPAVTVAPQPRPAIPPGAVPVRVVTGNQPTIAETPQVPVTEQPKSQDEILQQWLRVQLGVLKDKARKGKQAESWIDYILDNQEEPGCHAVIVAIEQGALFEHVLAFDPEIAQDPLLHSWFKTLYDGLHEEISSAPPAVDTGGAAGNADHAAGDEGSRATGQPAAGSPGPGAGAAKPAGH
jgi:hypothetical protein